MNSLYTLLVSILLALRPLLSSVETIGDFDFFGEMALVDLLCIGERVLEHQLSIRERFILSDGRLTSQKELMP